MACATSSIRSGEREQWGITASLLPLPACHQGVYARRSLSLGPPKAGPDGRAMERVGVRGRFHTLRLAATPPHPSPLPASGEREQAAAGGQVIPSHTLSRGMTPPFAG